MREVLEFIFRDFWTFAGFFLLMCCLARIRAFEINHYCSCDKKENIYFRSDDANQL